MARSVLSADGSLLEGRTSPELSLQSDAAVREGRRGVAAYCDGAGVWHYVRPGETGQAHLFGREIVTVIVAPERAAE